MGKSIFLASGPQRNRHLLPSLPLTLLAPPSSASSPIAEGTSLCLGRCTTCQAVRSRRHAALVRLSIVPQVQLWPITGPSCNTVFFRPATVTSMGPAIDCMRQYCCILHLLAHLTLSFEPLSIPLGFDATSLAIGDHRWKGC
jgi:hypothetical protein